MALPPQFNNNILRLNVRCPVCTNLYDLQKLQILGERDQQLLTYIDCSTCGTALLSILSMGQGGMTAQGLVTDLVPEEIVNLDLMEPVGPDEVIDLHAMLLKDDTAFLKQRPKRFLT